MVSSTSAIEESEDSPEFSRTGEEDTDSRSETPGVAVFSDNGSGIEAILGECVGVPNEVITATHTDPKDWILVKEGSRRRSRNIEPIPYELRPGESEEFDVRLTADQLESLVDEHGDIRFERMVEYLLPDFAATVFSNRLLGECAIICNT